MEFSKLFMIAHLFSTQLMVAYPPMAHGIFSSHSFVRHIHEVEADFAPLRGLGPDGENMVRLCASIVFPPSLSVKRKVAYSLTFSFKLLPVWKTQACLAAFSRRQTGIVSWPLQKTRG